VSAGQPTTEPLVLSTADATAVISPHDGGRLASLVVGGRELLVTDGGGDPMQWGAFPMAPYAGRIRRGLLRYAGREHRLPVNLAPHAIHGTVFDRPWVVGDDGSLSCPLGPRWPFGGFARQRVELRPGALACTLEVHAEDEPFPATAGFHPWFARPVELRVHPSAMYRRDADGIPTGELVPPPAPPWDDCFVGLDTAPALAFDGGPIVTVESDADHWVIFTPDHALCVEPQTGPPDGPNLAPEIVQPGEPLSVTMTIRWDADGALVSGTPGRTTR
jgi:aldose 1-epimerase